MNEADLEAIKRKLNEMFNKLGVQLAGFYYCPHDREGTVTSYATHCDCRKPQPGMLFRAAREHSLDLSESWFIGDILNDVEAGNRAGCHTILFDNGNETEWIEGPYRNPDHKVSNLAEAAGLIIQHSYEKKETSA
ncbi:MAG TPA: HAD-IIIA family hydrolase [Bacteroidales bacterium]|nr:HAD-IIIA family hydrolase [Bacteroidales bacterium]